MVVSRKQALLARHRRRKRLLLYSALLVLVAVGLSAGPWWAVLGLLLLWVAHEAWLADHLFYAPDSDYHYDFPAAAWRAQAVLEQGRLRLTGALPEDINTLFLAVTVAGRGLGRLREPAVWVGDDDVQAFERGAAGRRYLNLSAHLPALRGDGLALRGRHLRLQGPFELIGFTEADCSQQPLMILAPHADDAELAAFGLYQRAAAATLVTLTQGEIEAGDFRRLGLSSAQAAILKGRLRSWDSLAIPLWGGVPAARCWQLGYYCLQLPAMAAAPDQPQGSRESGECDIRSVRQHNPAALPGDQDGAPTWRNLVADLAALIERERPHTVVTPHPELDPHPDHIFTTRALEEALANTAWQPQQWLLYANHLHDNDRWPMGPAGASVPLPPALEPLPADPLWSPGLSAAAQCDKAMALRMQHDLQTPLSAKIRLRRAIQRRLTGRQWPLSGEDEFFRKAVRRQELFWVRRWRGRAEE